MMIFLPIYNYTDDNHRDQEGHRFSWFSFVCKLWHQFTKKNFYDDRKRTFFFLTLFGFYKGGKRMVIQNSEVSMTSTASYTSGMRLAVQSETKPIFNLDDITYFRG
ncbi:hypothetical protein CIY_00310 [Butyrivibrio fibrisolvens 16/4]|nr:hypothetical protein CIY_00310 [Butyrivibrio fibrisolvens 16/4]